MTPQGYQRLDGHRCERLTDADAPGEYIGVEIIGVYKEDNRRGECYVMRYYYDWRCVLTYYPANVQDYYKALDIVRAMADAYKREMGYDRQD